MELDVMRYPNDPLPTWQVSERRGSKWWIAVKLANGDWSISSGPNISAVNPSGTLGRKIIKAISTHGSGGNDAV